jgi:hypothetical protein
MQEIKNKMVNLAIITPENKITTFSLCFDLTIDQKLIKIHEHMIFNTILENMKLKCDCKFYVRNVAKAVFPEESYYDVFFEDNTDKNSKSFNKIGTHIINNIYDSDTNYNKRSSSDKCFGNCYILHTDQYYNMYDVGSDTFINLYNKVHTITGIVERDYFNRVFKEPNSTKCYLYVDYSKKKHGKCSIM